VSRIAARHDALVVTLASGVEAAVPADVLRAASPSAAGARAGSSATAAAAAAMRVGIMGVERVGHYALRIEFDDLHTSGIFPWALLERLAMETHAREAGAAVTK
jgi:DUF971 family protein